MIIRRKEYSTAQYFVAGMILLFNPTSELISKTIRVPVYYTGLTKTAQISNLNDDSKWSQFFLSRDFHVNIRVSLEPQSMAYMVIM